MIARLRASTILIEIQHRLVCLLYTNLCSTILEQCILLLELPKKQVWRRERCFSRSLSFTFTCKIYLYLKHTLNQASKQIRSIPQTSPDLPQSYHTPISSRFSNLPANVMQKPLNELGHACTRLFYVYI